MSLWRQLTHGARALARGATRDRELADEVQHYFDQSVAAHVARGQSITEARRAAQREIGNVTVAREQVRSYGWENTVDDLLADARYAARRLRTNPGFTGVAVITLALGIGGSTAIFSAVNPILFEPLPYPGATRLVAMEDQLNDGSGLATTFGTYRELTQRTRSFDGITASTAWRPTLMGRDQPERIDGQWVTANYFRVLGVPPVLGRDFNPADARPNGATTVILSNRLWRREFDADTGIIGRRIRLDDVEYAVVGVLPAGFESVPGSPADVWSLAQFSVGPLGSEGPEWAHILRLTARLRPGMSIDQARVDLDAVARNPLPQFRRPPWAAMQRALRITALHEDATRAVKPALLAVFGAVLLVLVIACVNVTNLLLARGVQRQGELAMRAALGAGRGRLVRQLLTESLMLAVVGGAVGIGVAYVGVRALIALAPPNLPRMAAIGVDGSALMFALAVSTLIGLAIGLSPAFQASRTDLKAGLQEGTRRVSGGHHLARRALVIAEVALALMLLVSAGLLFRSLELLFSVDPGFAPAQLATMQLQISGQRYRNDTVTFDFVARALDAVRRVPGVTAASFTSQLPLSGDDDEYGVHFQSSETARTASSVIRYGVTPGYFETMGIPLVHGRLLEKTDRLGTPLAVVLNESFAKRMFPGKDPVGQHLHIGPDRGPWFSVVGVVRDVKHLSLAGRESDAAYIPTDQSWFADRVLWLVARVQGDPSAIAPRLREAIWSVDKTQSIVRVGSMDHVVAESAAQRRFAMIVFEVFAVVALVLAAIGIYGVISGSVTERIREIGIRSALGASSRDIVALVVRQGMTMAVIGIVLGLPAAVAATRLLVTLLYGVSRVDTWTYVAVVVLLGGVAAVACWIPASRAARVDPTITLRQ